MAGEANPGKEAKEVGRRCSHVCADGPVLAFLSSLLYILNSLHLLYSPLWAPFSDDAALRTAINNECPTGHRL